MTTKECAEYLNVSVSHLRYLLSLGKLKFTKLSNGQLFIDSQDLKNFVKIRKFDNLDKRYQKYRTVKRW